MTLKQWGHYQKLRGHVPIFKGSWRLQEDPSEGPSWASLLCPAGEFVVIDGSKWLIRGAGHEMVMGPIEH